MIVLLAAMLIGQSNLAVIGPAPAFSLTDQNGQSFGSERLKGRVVLVGFVYTTCGGVCPATTHKMYRIQEALRREKLWGEKVQFVSISVDPERDTPDVLARYAATYDADTASWHFLTGDSKNVSKVVSDWGMWARRNSEGVLDHPSRIFLLDSEGRIREIYSLEFLEPASVVADMRALLAEARATDRTAPPAPGAASRRN